jgi:hypothetical protein
MIRKLTLAAGFGAGYVLGAKAGTQRYEQIVAKARELAGMPAVQEVTSNLTQTASSVADKAKSTVNETITSVNDKAAGGTTAPAAGTSPTGYETGAAPMTGAAASKTV